MSFNLYITQVKREFWESKSRFIYAPIVATLVFLLTAGFCATQIDMSAILLQNNDVQSADQILTLGAQEKMFTDVDKKLPQSKLDIYGIVIVGMTMGNSIVLGVLLLAVSLHFAHTCLFDDRKNRDVLLWRSLPVSETVNVFIKLALLIFYFPLLVLVLNLLVGLISFIIITGYLMLNGAVITALMSSFFNSEKAFFVLNIFVFMQSLAILVLPVTGFILLTSAFSKKSPFLITTLVPLLLIALDKMFRATSHINLHIIDALMNYLKMLNGFRQALMSSKGIVWDANLAVNSLLLIILGIVFIAAAIWLRNNRYEI